MVKTADKRIKEFIRKVKLHYQIDKAIFFGSRVRGDHLLTSDYDVILVSKDFKDIFFTKRISEMYKYWNHYPLEIEPLCYTPEEFNIKKKQLGIVRHAVKEGIVLK